MRTVHRILKSDYRELLGKARRLADDSGREICGLLVDTGGFLKFVETSNVSKQSGSFQFRPGEIRKICAAVKALKLEVVGTFHSHPVSTSKPGPSDIKYAVDDSLMFIFDCIGRRGDLWKITGDKALKVKWEVDHSRTRKIKKS